MKIKSFNAKRAELFGYELTNADKMILLRSPLHTHSELVFGPDYNCVSFSATMADNAKCARFKDIQYSHAFRWDTVEISATPKQEADCYANAIQLAGRPYDLLGLLLQYGHTS